MNIKEMAKLAGVSCATISRVLNDSGYVKEDTRKKVMEIIREYNYTPNMIARSLSSKDSFNIGIIIPNVGEKQYGKILEGAAKETAKHGYSLVFMDSENDQKTEKKWLEEVKNQHMKGLVLVPVCSENKELRGALQELEEQGTAVVLTEKDVKNAGMDGVFADEFRGAYEGICRLVEKGCKKIAIILGQPEMDVVTEERYRGCLQALEDNGISGAEKMVLREAEDLSRVFQGKKLPDAFLALNQIAADQCIRELLKCKKVGMEKIIFMGMDAENTAQKVMEIIREYNYTPNMIARSLSSKDSFNIGIIIPNVGEKQYGKILEGAAKETAKHGYSLVFMDSENDQKTEKKWLEEVKNQHMKGLVLVPVCSENKELRGALQELEEQGTAVVLTEKDVKNAGMDGVFADEFRGAYEGICRLVEKGCKKIAIILGQPEMDVVTEERYRGCLQALEDNGISGAEKMVLREAEDLSRVFQGKKLPDAFLALNQIAADQCIRELLKCKKVGMEKIIFMGMDAENTAQVLGDEMISVEKDRRKQGKEAVKLLLEAFDAEENDRIRGKRIMIPYKVTESGAC